MCFSPSSRSESAKRLASASGGRGYPSVDAPESGRQDHREGQVRIAGGVRGAVLEAGGVDLAGLDHRDAHEGRAVVARPADVDRGLVAADQPLVRVHPLVGHGGDLPRVVQQSGDEPVGHVGQPVLVVRVDEGVVLVAPQREVRVHARSLDVGQRLGHEAGEDVGLAGQLLHHVAHRHHRVAHGEGVGVAQVDLVLSAGVFVLRVLDRDAHLLEHEDRAPSQCRRSRRPR